jgi:phospholipase D1/2
MPSGIMKVSMVYIHAKVMIIDDRVASVGSANINDRSLMGDHDTEIAVVCEMDTIEPIDVMTSIMAGQAYNVSRYAYNLRMNLWNEHLGLPINDRSAVDVMDDHVWKVAHSHTSYMPSHSLCTCVVCV